MERCVRSHRFVVLLCVSACLCAVFDSASHAKSSEKQITERALAAISAVAPRQPRQNASQQQSKSAEYTLSRDRREKAVAYSHASYILYVVDTFLVIFALAVILRLGIAARFRDWSERVSDKKWLQAFVFVPLLVFAADIASLPVRVSGHILSVRYEMSVQGWESWFSDWSKEEALTIVFALILALILTAIIRRSPRLWWLHFWFAALPVVLFFVFISPWIVDPLFNTYEPLQANHPDLVAAIEKLTQRARVPIPPDRMFLMKASQKTTAVNAYVTGLGASRRVVIYDTTLQKATTNETLFIVGHELGHYVLGHVWKGFLFAAALLLIGFYALFRALHWALGRWSGDWRIYGQEDWASLAVLLLLANIGTFLLSPVVNGFSRMQEHDADVYGLEVVHGIIPDSADVAARSFQVLGEVDLADPNPPPFIVFWLYSHPPLAERLAFADSYDPWSRGESPKYVK